MSRPEEVWNTAWHGNWQDDEGTIHRILRRANAYSAATRFAQCVSATEMKMVAHYKQKQNCDLKMLQRLPDQFEEARAIVLIAENRLRGVSYLCASSSWLFDKTPVERLKMLDETHSGSILFACVGNPYLLLHFDRFCSQCSGHSF
jgi:hypothetical protein